MVHDGVMPGLPSWDEWLVTLNESDRAQAVDLHGRFRSLGVGDPESWTRSEVDGDIAQLGRLLFLRAVWAAINQWGAPGAVEPVPVADELMRTGVDASALRRFARQIAHGTALGIVAALDRLDPDQVTQPGWALVETQEDGTKTGRDLGDLHESFYDADPSGRGGSDFLPAPDEA